MVDIVCYYEKSWRSWVVYEVDADGNQIWPCEYYPHKDALKKAFFGK